MIKYLIIDDEYIAHEIIKGYCDLLSNLEFVKSCYDAIEAIEYLNENKVDLIFLDLNMPKLKGFEFLRTLPLHPKVIVTTAYKEYAIEGYELNVSDYLLKPFSFERFLKAINKAVSKPPGGAPDSLTSGEGNYDEKRIFLRSDKKYLQVIIDNIRYLESAGNYTKVVTADETISVREKVSELVIKLGPTDFVQVHKSFAVAVKHIASIEGNRITIGDSIIPIGKMYKLKINQLLI